MSGAQCSARLPCGPHARKLNHVTDAATDASPRTGSVARLVQTLPLDQPRTFISPRHPPRGRAPRLALRLFAERGAFFFSERGCGRLIAARTADRAVGASGALVIIQPRSGEALGSAAGIKIGRTRISFNGSSDRSALLNFGLTPRHQPASDPLRQCPERRESSCLPHVHSMRSAHGKSSADEYAQK